MKHTKFVKALFLLMSVLFVSCERDSNNSEQLQPPICSQPLNLTASNITGQTAVLSWTSGGAETEWEVEIIQEAGVPTHLGIPVTTNSYTVNGLVSGTGYQYYVKAVCSSTESSDWSGPFLFTTN